MEAATLFASANLAYVQEEYEEALKRYTCAVTLEDSAEHRACRAACYLKLGRFAEVLTDCEQALQFDAQHHIALHWKGVALFYLGEFASAKLSFEASQRASPGAKAPRALWIRKCDAELSGSTLPLGGIAVEATKAAAPQLNGSSAHSAPVSAPAAAAPVRTADVPMAPAGTTTSQSQSSLSISGRKPIKREWYQNNTSVVITLFAKDVRQDELKVEFLEQELNLTFPLPGATDEEYQLNLELGDTIEPSMCKVEVTPVKVEISLVKKHIGVAWKDLERKEEIIAPTQLGQPAYPTSSKQKRDWSQIEADIESDLKTEKPGGDDALNKLFREIYERADEDTRRAMNKSFQTSGGTVLSTNWGEVARNDYEGKDRPTPPDGQEWRDWRKK